MLWLRSTTVLILLSLLCGTLPLPSAAQVAPVQPTPEPPGNSASGITWAGTWPETVTVGEEDVAGFDRPATLLVTDAFDCYIFEGGAETIARLFEIEESTFTLSDASRMIDRMIQMLRQEAPESVIALEVAVDEGGQLLEFRSAEHAWVFLYGMDSEHGGTIFFEVWLTGQDLAVVMMCAGPDVAEFNDHFHQFLVIHRGMSFPGLAFDEVGTPFAGFETAETVTPEPTDSFAARFLSLASSMPDVLSTHSDEFVRMSFADYQRQTEVAKVNIPETAMDEHFTPWIWATSRLPNPPGYSFQGLEDWHEFFGFTYFDVDQVLSAYTSDEYLDLYRGNFHRDTLESAWISAGYYETNLDGMSVFVLGGDDFFDITIPASIYGNLGQMNYAALLPNGILAFTSHQFVMESVIGTAVGDQKSTAEHPGVKSLVANVHPNLVSMVVVQDSGFGASSPFSDTNFPLDIGVDEQRRDEMLTAKWGQLPGFSLLLLGETAGSPGFDPASPPHPEAAKIPGSTMQIGLLYDESDDAEVAGRIVVERLSFMRSSISWIRYLLIVEHQGTSLDSESGVVIIDLRRTTPGLGWLVEALDGGDLRFLMYGP